MLRALLLAAACGAASSFSAGHTCGNDHPHYAEETSAVPVVVPQAYHAQDLADGGRALQAAFAQNYGSTAAGACGANWVPLSNATARPIRITIVWDVLTTGDTGVCDDGATGPCTYQCSFLFSTNVRVKNAAGTAYSSTGFSCGAGDLVGNTIPTPTNVLSLPVNLQIMYARTTAAAEYWASTLSLVPVLDPIVVRTSGLGLSGNAVTGHLPAGSALTYSNTDLVVIMTARPSPNSPIAGYASCLQADQWGRCTVGHFNWVPSALDRAGFALASESSKDIEMHTALHELVHVFGGMGPGYSQKYSNFVNNANGCRAATASVLTTLAEDPAYVGSGKPVTYISSPKVLSYTRAHYACPTAKGFPLEDVPLGKGAHWEARVAGSELMSYGSNTGQTYISDLTLAYLEDTGRYYANYSKAGFITTSAYNSLQTDATASTFLGPNNALYVPPAPLPPGVPRWGYQAGCAWLGQAAANPPPRLAMPAPYTCATNNAQVCSADNRLSAQCVVQATHTRVSNQPSWGKYVQLQENEVGTGGPQAYTTPGAAAGYANPIPAWARWFTTDADAAAAAGVAASAASTGGFNDAMDYIPVPLGYWSCAFQSPGSNASLSEGGYSLSSLAQSVGSLASDMSKFGGQLRCPSCRCMQSSLMEMSTGNLNSDFPSYGLCYRTNCAMPDYLQIGVRGQYDGVAYWYACPAAGGKLYIPGYFGALTCPVAKDFCRLEAITGVRYPEQSIYYEWIFWAAVCGFAFLVYLSCALHCLRERCIRFWKYVCGVRVFDPPGHRDEHGPAHLPPDSPKHAHALLVISWLTFACGAGIAGTAAYIMKTTLVFTGTVQLLGVGVLLLHISVFGLCGARAKPEIAPSCWLISYFVMNTAHLLLTLYVVIYQFQFQSWSQTVTTYYQSMVTAGYFVPSGGNTTLAQNIELATTKVTGDIVPIAGLAIAVLVIEFAGLVAAGLLINGRVLVAMVLTLCHNIFVTFGALMLAVSIYIYSANSRVLAPMYDVLGYMIGLSLLFAAVGATGHATVRHKNNLALYVSYFVFTCLLFIVCVGITWTAFSNRQRIVTFVQTADDKTLGPVASSLGFSGDKSSILSGLTNNLNQIGLAFGVVLMLQFVTIVCAVAFAHTAKQWREEFHVPTEGLRVVIPGLIEHKGDAPHKGGKGGSGSAAHHAPVAAGTAPVAAAAVTLRAQV